jgi:hypothetical protein
MRASLVMWRFAYDQQSGKLKEFKADVARDRVLQTSYATTVLTAHGRLGNNLSHLVLAEFPLAYLNDLAGPAYEACAGERYWQTSLRRQELTRWWTECRENRRKTLFIVASDASEANLADRETRVPKPATTRVPHIVAKAAAEGSDSKPKDEIRRLTDEEAGFLASAWRVSHQVVTPGEFAALLHDGQLEPVPYDSAVGFPRCILHDGQGFRCGELASHEATAERLETMLRPSIGGVASGK